MRTLSNSQAQSTIYGTIVFGIGPSAPDIAFSLVTIGNATKNRQHQMKTSNENGANAPSAVIGAQFPPRPKAIATFLASDDFLPGCQTLLHSIKVSGRLRIIRCHANWITKSLANSLFYHSCMMTMLDASTA